MSAPALPNRCTFFAIVYKPFEAWKKAERNFLEARRRGFEILVASDDRNSPEDVARLQELADTVVPFHSNGHCEGGYKVLAKATRDFALMIADDEIPSENLWRFAAAPTSASRFGVPVIPILGDKVLKGHVGIQERLIWVDGWRFVPRTLPDGRRTLFEGHVQSPVKPVLLMTEEEGVTSNPAIMIWHYLLAAPRAEREEKAARYYALDPAGDHTSRLFYEEQPEALVPIPEDMRRHLPR